MFHSRVYKLRKSPNHPFIVMLHSRVYRGSALITLHSYGSDKFYVRGGRGRRWLEIFRELMGSVLTIHILLGATLGSLWPSLHFWVHRHSVPFTVRYIMWVSWSFLHCNAPFTHWLVGTILYHKPHSDYTTRKSGLWWSIFPTTSLKHTHNVPLLYCIFLLPPLSISRFGVQSHVRLL